MTPASDRERSGPAQGVTSDRERSGPSRGVTSDRERSGPSQGLTPAEGTPPAGPGDEDLLGPLGRGEDGAIARFVERHRGALYRLAYRLTGNHADADDLVQETFVKALGAISKFRGDSALGTWLHRIAVNLSVNRFRSFAVSRRDSRTPDDLPLASPARAVGELIGRQRQQMIREAVGSLPPRQREVLVLHVYEEWTFPRIAKTLGCPIGTAKANFFHAVTNLRKRLAPRGAVPRPGAAMAREGKK